MDYPERLSRWLIFVKWLFVIPSMIVLMLLGVVYYVVLLIAWFAILITGRHPKGLFNFGVGVIRWSFRINAYSYLMTDKYPPFSLS